MSENKQTPNCELLPTQPVPNPDAPWWPRLPKFWRYVCRTDEWNPVHRLNPEAGLLLHRSGYVQAEDQYFREDAAINFRTPSGTHLFRVSRGVLFVLGPRLDEQCFSYGGEDWHELVPIEESDLTWACRIELWLKNLIRRI